MLFRSSVLKRTYLSAWIKTCSYTRDLESGSLCEVHRWHGRLEMGKVLNFGGFSKLVRSPSRNCKDTEVNMVVTACKPFLQ